MRRFAWAAIGLGLLLLSDAHCAHTEQHVIGVIALLFALYALERLACFHCEDFLHPKS